MKVTEIKKRYGRLTIISDPYTKRSGKNRYTFVLTVCECGTKKEIRLSHIKSGSIQSCGCFRNEQNLTRSVTHGMTDKHLLYGVWTRMRNRCYSATNPRYNDYGGRGVRICKEWKDDYRAFHDWAINHGWKEGLHLDKDKLAPTKIGKMYCPKYCCFITPKENNRNKRNVLTQNQVNKIKALYSTGEYTMAKLGDIYGVWDTTICAIINGRNWA